MWERSHEDTPSQPFARIAFDQLFHQHPSQVYKTARDAHQTGIATQESTGHRENRLDLHVSGGPVAHDARRQGLELGAAKFRPSTMLRMGAQFACNDRFQSSAS